MQWRGWAIIGLVGIASAVWIEKFKKIPYAELTPSPIWVRPSPSSHFVATSQAHLNHSSFSKIRATRARLWQKFQKKFGPELKAEVHSDGRVISIQGTSGKGKPASSSFDPADPSKVIARGQELLAEAKELIGIWPEGPLGNPVVHVSPVSAQLFFHETIDGLPVTPVGSVKVVLGPSGELLALYSDYVPQIKVMNEERLSSEAAKEKAIAVVKGGPSEAHGKKVIWVNDENQGHIAFDFRLGGHQVLIDAQTGKVLYSKDVRQY